MLIMKTKNCQKKGQNSTKKLGHKFFWVEAKALARERSWLRSGFYLLVCFITPKMKALIYSFSMFEYLKFLMP